MWLITSYNIVEMQNLFYFSGKFDVTTVRFRNITLMGNVHYCKGRKKTIPQKEF